MNSKSSFYTCRCVRYVVVNFLPCELQRDSLDYQQIKELDLKRKAISKKVQQNVAFKSTYGTRNPSRQRSIINSVKPIKFPISTGIGTDRLFFPTRNYLFSFSFSPISLSLSANIECIYLFSSLFQYA